jgi:L-ribulose-5-phosphate 4-epimerase
MQAIKEKIVAACRLLVHLKLDSGPFGNVSMRVPETDEYWVNPEGVLFEQITVDDLVRVNINGDTLEGKHAPHPGNFIHREMYRRRKDVNAIVHTHSANTVAMSLLGVEIGAYTQLGASLFGDQGIYHGFTGPVRSANEGAAIAEALADKSMVIAKNHGVFTVGASMQSAWWDMVVADIAAKIHVTALQMGLPPAEPMAVESLAKSRVEVRAKQCDMMWNAYLRSSGWPFDADSTIGRCR